MILESRSLIFSDEELVLALRPILEGKGMSGNPPLKDVISFLDEDGDVTVRFDLTDGSDSIVFSSREVGAAVLNHCIERGIPLPRGAYKELAIRGDHVALIVRMESGGMSPVDEDE
ncbi:hypothetical protein [Kordiimonas marina]|uniref:hypothetical protein n=1 Tax=Kordiimonas marina TaxID=2872312 RepID=UPI001FF49240|nr:hypothetical protein [Kordiimonas marina]MCJ9428211.1 hypothetical protein [Kordiimonas marina]